MLCALEIAMLVFGIMSLVNGKLTLDKKTGLRGTPAYLAGFLLLLPMPLAMVGGFMVGFNAAQQGRSFEEDQWLIIAIEAGATLTILVMVLLLCAAVGETFPPSRRDRRREEDYEDEYDDRPQRRYRDDDYEDEEDDRQWEELRRRRERYRKSDSEPDEQRPDRNDSRFRSED